MAVEVDGEGDPVVMVHGLGGTTNTWTPLIPALTNAKRIRIELPGSGRSHRAHVLQDNTPHKGRLSMDLLVDAVLRVCAQLGVSRAHFAGHSMGTIVCQHLAVRAPERVRSLALFGTLLAPPDPARQGLKTRAAKARDEGMFGIADAIVQGSLSSSSREQLPVVVAFVRESLLAQDPEGYARTCEALAAADPAAIEGIDAPTHAGRRRRGCSGIRGGCARYSQAHRRCSGRSFTALRSLDDRGARHRVSITPAPIPRALDGD